MAATTAAVVGAAAATKGVIDSGKAAKAAANQKAPQVNIAELQTQAQNIARENAANSAALEAQYNPGAAALRAGGLQALIGQLGAPTTERDALVARIATQAGAPLNVPGAQQYDSALLRAAIAQAGDDLALGGVLPADVRNLVARRAIAGSGAVTGGLTLGRDMVARDLGLTSLDLANRRLQNAAALGQAEAALEAGNANLRADNDRNRIGAEQWSRANLFDSANFLNSVNNGDFQRAFMAAQLGQNIAQPMSGLDPGTVGNIAVGNMNASAAQQQSANALRMGAANSLSGFGLGLAGLGIGAMGQQQQPSAYSGTYQPPLGGNAYSAAYVRSN